MNLKKVKLGVDKKFLVLLSGAMWCGVGIMLVIFAVTWLTAYSGEGTKIFYMCGFVAAMPIHHFGFLKLADKNLNRLLLFEEKRNIFTFITWKSYIIIVIMVSMGIALRHSAIPKQYLSILYNGIGLALFLSGIRYLRYFVQLLLDRK
jgi:hypothetical protein